MISSQKLSGDVENMDDQLQNEFGEDDGFKIMGPARDECQTNLTLSLLSSSSLLLSLFACYFKLGKITKYSQNKFQNNKNTRLRNSHNRNNNKAFFISAMRPTKKQRK